MLQLCNVAKNYRTEDVETAALVDVSLSIDQGEFVAVMGPSGCGKSTLLNVLGLLDPPTRGSYRLLGEDVSDASERERTRVRRGSIGFIFQSFNLIDDLTVADNIDVALIYRGFSRSERKRRVGDVLDRVGLSHRAKHLPAQLSGGMQQRAAIARALVADPKLLLADEPTGNLDTVSGSAVLELLTMSAKAGTTVVMVTHSRENAAVANRIVSMLDGRISSGT